MNQRFLNQIKVTESNKKILKNIVAPMLWTTENTSIHRHSSILNRSYNFTQEPAVGSLVYCQLGTAEHSGIYIGNKNIIELNGKGEIRKVELKEFTNNILSVDKDIFIPVMKYQMIPVGHVNTAKEAIKNLSGRRKYHLFQDNCHQFSAGCMIGNLDNDCNYLYMVKEKFAKVLFLEESNIVWVRWKWYLD